MNISNWCKSFLSIYNIIPDLTKSIDKLVLVRGINSSAVTFAESTVSCERQVQSIINLTQKKINLINLKVLTDEILTEMSKNNAKILILKYIDEASCDKIIELFKLSRRTFFRRVNGALKEFESLFKKKLTENEKVYKSFLQESFFEDVFARISFLQEHLKNQSENVGSKYSNSICSFILNKMKRA